MIELGMTSSGGSWGGIGDALGGIASAIGQYAIQKKAMKASAKANAGGGGYRPMGGTMALGWSPAAGAVAGGLLGAGASAVQSWLDPNNPQSYGGQVVDAIQGQSCQKFALSNAAQRARPLSLISDVNPTTGRTHWWRHVGQPILFSGDVSHCKRVGKLLGKASRKAGLRRGR